MRLRLTRMSQNGITKEQKGKDLLSFNFVNSFTKLINISHWNPS